VSGLRPAASALDSRVDRFANNGVPDAWAPPPISAHAGLALTTSAGALGPDSYGAQVVPRAPRRATVSAPSTHTPAMQAPPTLPARPGALSLHTVHEQHPPAAAASAPVQTDDPFLPKFSEPLTESRPTASVSIDNPFADVDAVPWPSPQLASAAPVGQPFPQHSMRTSLPAMPAQAAPLGSHHITSANQPPGMVNPLYNQHVRPPHPGQARPPSAAFPHGPAHTTDPSQQHHTGYTGPRPPRAPAHRQSVDEALQRVQMSLSSITVGDSHPGGKAGRTSVSAMPTREPEPVTPMGALGKKMQQPAWVPPHSSAPRPNAPQN
jgi:hypothetical protein